jgi:hypothetical protein
VQREASTLRIQVIARVFLVHTFFIAFVLCALGGLSLSLPRDHWKSDTPLAASKLRILSRISTFADHARRRALANAIGLDGHAPGAARAAFGVPDVSRV